MKINEFQESGLVFTFPKNWVVKKYDDHRFYHYLAGLGFKGVDFIAITPEKKLILIEAKNYINRYLEDGIDPTETLLNNTSSFSEQYIQKFENTIQLLNIVQKYFHRKKWYRWVALPFRRWFSFSFLISLDWGFWTFANELLEQNRIQLILWLEIEPNLDSKEAEQVYNHISTKFQDALPQYSFSISNYEKNVTLIKVSHLKS